VLPEEQPQGRCLGPAPEGAGPSPTRGPAGGVPGASTLPSAEASGGAGGPGHRRLIARHSSVEVWALRRRSPSPTGVERGMPQAACHGESCRTPLMVVSKIAPPSTSACASTPSTLPPSTERGAHRGEHATHRGGSRWLLHGLLRCVPSARGCQPRVLFRPCRFSRLRRLAPHLRLQVCCTLLPTMGFAWLQASDQGRPATPAEAVVSDRPPTRAARSSHEGSTLLPRTVSATPSPESSEAGVHAADVAVRPDPEGSTLPAP
jgi:hypothetical protein